MNVALYYRAKALRLATELRDWKAAYERLVDERNNVVLDLHEAEQRVADLEHHLELMSCDNADMERTLAAMRDGLRWFDPTAGESK